jgi:hypothetical protein
MQNAHLRMGRLEFTTPPGRNSTGTRRYDSLDRMIAETQRVGGNQYALQSDFNADGNRTGVHYPRDA